MKNLLHVILCSVLLVFIFSCAPKNDYLALEKEYKLSADTISFPRQVKFQFKTNEFLKLKDIKREKYFGKDILDTKEKAVSFAKNLAILDYPNSIKAINKYTKISEDATKQLWFVSISLAESGEALDAELSMIIFKNNCKVIFKTRYF